MEKRLSIQVNETVSGDAGLYPIYFQLYDSSGAEGAVITFSLTIVGVEDESETDVDVDNEAGLEFAKLLEERLAL